MRVFECETCGMKLNVYENSIMTTECICGGIKTPLKAQTEPVAEVPCSAGLSDELISAIGHMAIAINLSPDDNPCVTMHPKIWLLWETILFKAGIEPDIE